MNVVFFSGNVNNAVRTMQSGCELPQKLKAERIGKWNSTILKFAEMIERHWDGIGACCKPENKVSLGFVEGLNNKFVSSSVEHMDCVTKNT